MNTNLRDEEIEKYPCPVCGEHGKCVQLGTASRMYRSDYHSERKLRAAAEIERLRILVRLEAEEIERLLRTPHHITFTEITMLPTEGGNTLIFTGTLTPSGATFPAGTTFTVTSNDPAVIPTVDATGLIVTIPLPAGWVESATTPLAITWATSTFTPEPSTSPASLTATITPSAPPVGTPTGITFAQTT